MPVSIVTSRFLLLSACLTATLFLVLNSTGHISQQTPHKLAESVANHLNLNACTSPSKTGAPGFEQALPSCKVTDLYQDPLVIKYGRHNIKLSRSYEGSGERIKRVLEKALRGEQIRIGVVGGSVSAGHAILPPLTPDNYLYMHVFQWFQETFPQAEHVLDTSAALPATTNLYLSYCLLEHMPQDLDLVFVELDINSNPRSDESILSTGAVFRTILSLPSQPAIIYASVVALSFDDMIHGWMPSIMLAQWHDVPMINIRNFMLPYYFKHPDENKALFTNWASDVDYRHMNDKAHVALGDMIIGYLREQLCLLQREAPAEPSHDPDWPGLEITTTVPRLDILAKWSATESIPPYHPRCRSINSIYDPLVPVHNEGWTNVTHNGKMGWEATESGSQISFDFETAQGVAGFWFWHTWDDKFGNVECWVDDDQSAERVRHIEAYSAAMTAPVYDWTRNIWSDLPPGKHIMTCKVVPGMKGGTMFRIQSTITR